MSTSTLQLNNYQLIIHDTSSYSTTSSINYNESYNQIYDWILIDGSCVYPGEAYYFSKKYNKWILSNASDDESAEVIGVIEKVKHCESQSLSKLVYYGKISFDNTDITLLDGFPYFLSKTNSQSNEKLGPENVRNLTIHEPLESKPVFIAIDNKNAIIINYRGHVNPSGSTVINYYEGTNDLLKCSNYDECGNLIQNTTSSIDERTILEVCISTTMPGDTCQL